MATVFRRKRTRANGSSYLEKKYTIQYRGTDGKTKRKSGYTDRGKSLQLAIQLEKDASHGKQFLDAKLPLENHIEDFWASLNAKNRTPKYISQTVYRIKRIMDGCGFESISDIELNTILLFLSSLRELNECSIKTSNYYGASMKQFCDWLVFTQRLDVNPLKALKPLNTDVESRRDRRTLCVEQFERFLDSTFNGKPFESDTGALLGPDRCVLYLLASTTGLRASEAASLSKSCFSFDNECPTVTVAAAYSKRKRKDVLSLRGDIAAILEKWMNNKTENEKLWPGTWKNRGAEMVRRDLKAAGIPFKTEEGVYDFHALRHQFISELARAGVHPKVAQKLARHSDINLTMNRYTHIELSEQKQALEQLPQITTDHSIWTQNWTQASVTDCHEQSPEGAEPKADVSKEKTPNPLPVLEFGVDLPDVTPIVTSSGGGTRTPDTRIMIPQTQSGKLQPDKDLEKHVQGCCPNSCPRIEIDSQLAQIIEAWPSLDSRSQRALLAFVEADEVTNGDKSCQSH